MDRMDDRPFYRRLSEVAFVSHIIADSNPFHVDFYPSYVAVVLGLRRLPWQDPCERKAH